jgi:hypothetical protein
MKPHVIACLLPLGCSKDKDIEDELLDAPSNLTLDVRLDGASINYHIDMPYDNPHYPLLNLAMGGNLVGAILANFSQAVMEIDYLRIFNK